MINVATGIIIQDGKVLLCQRKRGARYPLKWEFPGGKVEGRESPAACLQRELLEELNIRADVGELFHRQHYSYPDNGTFDVFYYLIPAYSGPLKNLAFESFTWVPLRELSHFDSLEGNKEVISKLMQYDIPRSPEKK